MGGQLFTSRQIALLRDRFAESGAGSIPGSWLADGTVDWAKLDASTIVLAGSDLVDGSVDWVKLDSASVYLVLDARYNALYATTAQGANADTAFGWGNHALAGYITAASLPQGYHDSLTAVGGETTMTLTATPVGQVFVIYTPAAGSVPIVWRLTTDYTIAGTTITFVTVTPLLAGDKVDVQYIG